MNVLGVTFDIFFEFFKINDVTRRN